MGEWGVVLGWQAGCCCHGVPVEAMPLTHLGPPVQRCFRWLQPGWCSQQGGEGGGGLYLPLASHSLIKVGLPWQRVCFDWAHCATVPVCLTADVEWGPTTSVPPGRACFGPAGGWRPFGGSLEVPEGLKLRVVWGLRVGRGSNPRQLPWKQILFFIASKNSTGKICCSGIQLLQHSILLSYMQTNDQVLSFISQRKMKEAWEFNHGNFK